MRKRSKTSEYAEKTLIAIVCVIGIPIIAVGVVIELATKGMEQLIPGKYNRVRPI